MRHVRVFLALCEHKTLTRAAEALNTVQPALSRTLKELEDEIGTPLFDRSSKGLRLTPEGKGLREHLAAGMAQIEQGVRFASGQRKSETVAIGILPNVARRLVPEAVARFKAQHPEVAVRLYSSSVRELVAKMREGEVDFLASRMLSLETQPGIVFEHLYDEPLIFVAQSHHPLSAGSNITPHELEPYPVIIPTPDTIIRRELDRYLFAQGYSDFPNRIETVTFEFARSFLEAGEAVACVPLGAVQHELDSGALVRLDMRGDDIPGNVGFSFLKDRELSRAARHLADCLRETAADLNHP